MNKFFINVLILFYLLTNQTMSEENIMILKLKDGDVKNQIISSRLIKEIADLNGDIKKFTTKSTIHSLKKKYE